MTSFKLDDDLDDLNIVHEWLQLGEDTQEKEKLIESGEYHWDNDLNVD